MWEEDFGTEEQLEEHLQDEHAADLQPICEHMLRGNAPDALISVYRQAIAEKCRGQAPIAGCSLDRTALHSFAEATAGNKIEALMCGSCGGIFPYVEEVADKGDIRWYQPLQRSEFLCECQGNKGNLPLKKRWLPWVRELRHHVRNYEKYRCAEPNACTKLRRTWWRLRRELRRRLLPAVATGSPYPAAVAWAAAEGIVDVEM